MTGPKPVNLSVPKPISKTRRASKKNASELHASPLTTAQASFTPDRHQVTSTSDHTNDPSSDVIVESESISNPKTSSRRVLDFSNIKVRSQTADVPGAVSTITTVGELSSHASARLAELDKDPRFLGKQIPSRFRQCKVNLSVIPIRVPDFSTSFNFVIFADYTGSLSIGAKSVLFTKSSCLSAFNLANQEILPVGDVCTMAVEGSVSFSRSNSNEDELFLAFNDSSKFNTIQTRISSLRIPPPSFAAMLHACKNSFNKGLMFPFAFGTCVLSEHEENEVTLTMQDPTGYAIVTIVDNIGDVESKNILISNFDGPLLIQSCLEFVVVSLKGQEVVKATVDLAHTKVSQRHEVLLKAFNSRLHATKDSHFIFDNPFLRNDPDA